MTVRGIAGRLDNHVQLHEANGLSERERKAGPLSLSAATTTIELQARRLQQDRRSQHEKANTANDRKQNLRSALHAPIAGTERRWR